MALLINTTNTNYITSIIIILRVINDYYYQRIRFEYVSWYDIYAKYEHRLTKNRELIQIKNYQEPYCALLKPIKTYYDVLRTIKNSSQTLSRPIKTY